MKKALIILGVACSVFFGMAALLSFKGEETASQPREAVVEPMAAPSMYTKDFTLDTITNAANDTLALGANILSNYEWSYHIIRTNISGTTNIAVAIQASGNAQANTIIGNDGDKRNPLRGLFLWVEAPRNRGRHRHTVEFV
jgi:hypothetical protein